MFFSYECVDSCFHVRIFSKNYIEINYPFKSSQHEEPNLDGGMYENLVLFPYVHLEFILGFCYCFVRIFMELNDKKWTGDGVKFSSADSFKSTFPFCVIKVQPTYVQYYHLVRNFNKSKFCVMRTEYCNFYLYISTDVCSKYQYPMPKILSAEVRRGMWTSESQKEKLGLLRALSLSKQDAARLQESVAVGANLQRTINCVSGMILFLR